MKELTKRQSEILGFIREFKATNGYPPVNREVAAHFSISVKAAFDHLKALERKGMVTSAKGRSRTIECVSSDADEQFRKVPLLGQVAAGIPIDAEENRDSMITVPNTLLKANKEYFALKVDGESMVEAGIMDGDIAIVQKQVTANNGDTVVARVDDGNVTLKEFYRESNRVRLQPRNSEMAPIFSQNVAIVGKLHILYRSYT